MWPNPQFSADLATFTREILNGKDNFCAVFISVDHIELPSLGIG